MPTTFKCPMCAAPLDLSSGFSGVTVRCPYCENTVILPEELRDAGNVNINAGQSAGASFAPIIDQAMKMAEVAQLLHAGHKIAAIKLYRETFCIGLKDAKDAVEKIERGAPLTFTQTRIGSGSDSSPSSPELAQPVQAHATNRKRGGRCLLVGLVLIVAITGAFILLGGGAALWVSRKVRTLAPTSPLTKPSANSFANVALEFGSEGIGAGQFKDARSVAVDGEGHIYTAEYIGGRVQVFDSEGKFVTQWMVDPKQPLTGMAAARKGIVYIVQEGWDQDTEFSGSAATRATATRAAAFWLLLLLRLYGTRRLSAAGIGCCRRRWSWHDERAAAIRLCVGCGDCGFEARAAGGQLIHLHAQALFLFFQLAASLFAQLFRPGRARERQRALDIFRFQVFIYLSRALLKLRLLRLDTV